MYIKILFYILVLKIGDAEWCAAAEPDCSLDYTQEHCKNLCKGKQIFRFLDARFWYY